MIQIKISGATPKSGKPLCHTCKHAKIVRGQNCEEKIYCGGDALFAESRNLVTFRVAECGEYHPINVPWKWEMEEMAWKIEARRRGPVGFSDGAPLEIIVTPPDKRNQNGAPE